MAFITRKLVLILIIILIIVCFIIFFETRNYQTNDQLELAYIQLKAKPPNSKKLFDLTFEYTLNSGVCETTDNTEILAVIIVTSYYSNVETRSAMRRAFPKDKLQEFNLRRIFLLGQASDDKYATQNAIIHESRRFGDLIQGNFNEAYRNLTYKHVMGLKWASTHCRNARFVIKMDDDIVVNVYKVVELLKNLKLPKKNLMAGYVLRGMTPIREPANKWYVTKEEYGGSSYPTFISGWFYITNPGVCQRLVEESSRMPYFWVDDVYVTGLLAQKLRIKHYSLKEYFTVFPEFLQCCMRDIEKYKYDCEVVVGPNGGDNNLFYDFNEIIARCYSDKCKKRIKPLNETCVAEKRYSLGKGNGLVETYRLV